VRIRFENIRYIMQSSFIQNGFAWQNSLYNNTFLQTISDLKHTDGTEFILRLSIRVETRPWSRVTTRSLVRN